MRRSVFALHGKLRGIKQRQRDTLHCQTRNFSSLPILSWRRHAIRCCCGLAPQDYVKSQKQYRDFGTEFGERRITPRCHSKRCRQAMADVYALAGTWCETLCFPLFMKSWRKQGAAERHIALPNTQFLFFARSLLATPRYPLLLRTCTQDSVKSQKQYRDFGAGFGERRITSLLSFKASV